MSVQRAIDLIVGVHRNPQYADAAQFVEAFSPDVLSVDELALVVLGAAAACGVGKPSPERLEEIAGHIETVSKRGLDLAEGLRRFSARTKERRP